MNYIVCKSCGLGNSPTAQSCIRCGVSFSSSANPSIKPEEPTKTAETLGNQLNYPPVSSQKSNSKIYWILGGLSVLILGGGLFIVVAAVGIYFYSSQRNVTKLENTDRNRTPYPINSRPTPSDRSTPSDKNGTVFSDEELAAVFLVKKQVGKFAYVSTLPAADTPDKKTFHNSGGEATAMYSGKGKNEDIIYSIASYSSSEKAQTEFKNFVEREKQKGARMIVEIMTDNRNKSINASYKMGVLTILTFCSWKVETAPMCHRIGSPQGASVVDFHNSWFGLN